MTLPANPPTTRILPADGLGNGYPPTRPPYVVGGRAGNPRQYPCNQEIYPPTILTHPNQPNT
jgi:hypothetical protein